MLLPRNEPTLQRQRVLPRTRVVMQHPLVRRFLLVASILVLAMTVLSVTGCGGTETVLTEAADGTEVVQTREGLNFLSLLMRGGWFMLPLLILSDLVVTIGVERGLALRRDQIFPQDFIDQLSLMSSSEGGLDPRKAYQACQQFPSSASYIMRSALLKVGRPQSEIENVVSESSQREATRLSQTSSWLSLAAAVAPLIGLLGTVWGITQAFYDTTQLVAGQNRAEALAQGIYTALVTTMCGLLIAIPAAVLAHYFDNRVIRMLNEIEEMIFSLLPQFERYEGQVRFTQGDDEPTSHPAPTPSNRDPQEPRNRDETNDADDDLGDLDFAEKERRKNKRKRAKGPRPARNPGS